jgi:delta14-sterol reductase
MFDKILGFLAPTFIYLIIFILNAILPGRWVTGYVTKTNTNEKLKYRLNGIPVLFTIVAWDWLYQYRWFGLAGACTFGIIFTLILVLPNAPVKKSFFADLYLGRLENPQLWGGRIDAKMWLYLIGAVLLELNVLSFTAHHWIKYGVDANPGIYWALNWVGDASPFTLIFIPFHCGAPLIYQVLKPLLGY